MKRQKKQTRRVIAKEPKGCVEKVKPVLEQPCQLSTKETPKVGEPDEVKFSGTAFDNWDLSYDKTKKRLLMTRKPAKIKAPCGWEASVTASLWVEFPKNSGSLKTPEDCTKLAQERFSKRRAGDTPNDMAVGLFMAGGVEGVKGFSIGDYRGAIADFALWMRRGSGSPWSGYAGSYFGSNGNGCAVKGDRIIDFGYKVGGGGCWDNSDRAYLISQGASAQQEARAILASLRLDPDGKITQEPYKGPKYDGSDLPKVTLSPPSLEKLKVGDTVKVTAEVHNAKPEDSPFTYNWGGTFDGKPEDNKKNATITIKPQKPGKYTLSVSVDGQRFNMGSASLQYEVVDYKVKIERVPPEKTPVPIGSKVTFKATLTADGKPASGNFIYRWQPHPEVEFSKLDSPQNDVQARFTRIGKVKVWVQVLEKKGEVLTSVVDSDQIEMDVIQPKLKLGANKTDPFVGEKVVLTVHEEPKMDDKTISFWWEYSGNLSNPGVEPNIANSRAYSFKPKDTKPVTVTVHAKAKDGGDDLGEAKITITAKSYQVSISEPRYHGPKPRIWKCDTQLGGACPGLVEVSDTQFAVFRDIFMKATVTPTPESPRYRWTVDPAGSCGFPGAGSEIKINCSQTGTYTVKVEVSNADGVKLGEATQTVTISISEEMITASNKAKEAYDKLNQAKLLVVQGKLDEGINLASEAAGLDPKNTEAKSLNDKWKIEREGIKQHITKADQNIKDNKLADAEKELQAAQKLHPKYQPVVDAEKRLKEAKDKTNKIKKDAEVKLNQAKTFVQQGKLDEAISLADDALKIEPTNNEAKTLLEKWKNDLQGIKKHIVIFEQMLKDNKLTEAERELQTAQRINPKHQLVVEAEGRLKAKKEELNQKLTQAQKLKTEGEAFERQGKLQDAVNKYKESLKIIPDKALDDRIKRLEVEIAKDAHKKQTADRLWDECSSLAKQNRLQEALAKCRESLNYWSNDRRLAVVRDMEQQTNQTNQKQEQCKRLMNEGNQFKQQGRLQDALAKYKEAHRLCPSADTEQHIVNLEAEIKKQQTTSDSATGTSAISSPYYHIDLTPYGGKKGSPRKVKNIEVDDGSWIRLKATHEKRLSLDISLPAPVSANSIAIVSNLDNAHYVKDDVTTTVLIVYTKSGSHRFEIKAGIHSSEWNRGETGGADHRFPKENHLGNKRWLAVFNLPQGSIVTGMRFDHRDTDPKYYHAGAAPGFCLRGITLIRSGTTDVSSDSGNAISTETKKGNVIFNNGNIAGVYNSPTRPTVFTLNQPHVITLIQNYHWNNARGSTPGTIALRDQSGRTYGPWQAKGSPGQGGVPNAYWTVYPNVTLQTGTYTVIDSEPSTWAQNSGSNGAGHTRIEGYPVSSIGGNQQTGNTNQQGRMLTAEFINSSSQNVHIFVEGDTFGPHNRATPGERKKLSITTPAQGGFIKFNAGRNGQVLATCSWEFDPDTISGRIPVVTFNEPNRLGCATGMR